MDACTVQSLGEIIADLCHRNNWADLGVEEEMIDVRSILRDGQGGREGGILRAVLWHSLAVIVGGIVWV